MPDALNFKIKMARSIGTSAKAFQWAQFFNISGTTILISSKNHEKDEIRIINK